MANLWAILYYVRDVDRSVRFYTEGLGLPLNHRAGDEFASIAVGNGAILLHSQAEVKPGTLLEKGLAAGHHGVGTILQIEVPDVDAFARDLGARGVAISYGPVDQPWGHRECYLYDPDGYNLVFFSRRPGTRAPG